MTLTHFNLPNPISKKMIEKSAKELKIVYQQCYLELQKALINFEKENPQKKEWCRNQRKDIGEIYLKTIKIL